MYTSRFKIGTILLRVFYCFRNALVLQCRLFYFSYFTVDSLSNGKTVLKDVQEMVFRKSKRKFFQYCMPKIDKSIR